MTFHVSFPSMEISGLPEPEHEQEPEPVPEPEPESEPEEDSDSRVPDISDIDMSTRSLPEDDFLQERSLFEDTHLAPPELPDFPLTFEVVDTGSQKGKKKLVDSYGFSYVVSKSTQAKVYWRCSVRGKKLTCSATVTQAGSSFTEGRHRHVHQPEPGKLTQVQVRVEIKKQALQDVFKSGKNIVEEVQVELVDTDQPGGLQNQETLKRMANRTRENIRPKEPTDLEFEIVEDFLPSDFLQADIMIKGERHIVFATARQLRHLCRGRHWFIDATFKVIRDPFYQLMSIHAFVRVGRDMKMMPLVFVMMSRRRTIDYIKVLRSIIAHLPDAPEVQSIVMDFELATWKAVKKVLPDVRIRGCLFHLTQAVWRKCVELGLKPAYMSDDKIHKFIRKLMALPFVPSSHIPELFRKISERVKTPGQLRDLLDYFQRQWVEHTTFQPKTWSAYNMAIRTNNHVEGWHRRLNDKCHERTLGLYRLVQQLHKEATLLPIQIRLIQEGKLRAFVRRHAAARQEEVFQAWLEFKDDDINVSQLLTRCAAIHGPIVD